MEHRGRPMRYVLFSLERVHRAYGDRKQELMYSLQELDLAVSLIQHFPLRADGLGLLCHCSISFLLHQQLQWYVLILPFDASAALGCNTLVHESPDSCKPRCKHPVPTRLTHNELSHPSLQVGICSGRPEQLLLLGTSVFVAAICSEGGGCKMSMSHCKGRFTTNNTCAHSDVTNVQTSLNACH